MKIESIRVRIEREMGETGSREDLRILVYLRETALNREVYIKAKEGGPVYAGISNGELELWQGGEIVENEKLKASLTETALFQPNLIGILYINKEYVDKVIESSISFEIYSMGGYSIELEPREISEELWKETKENEQRAESNVI